MISIAANPTDKTFNTKVGPEKKYGRVPKLFLIMPPIPALKVCKLTNLKDPSTMHVRSKFKHKLLQKDLELI